jgi:hypothetical protein
MTYANPLHPYCELLAKRKKITLNQYFFLLRQEKNLITVSYLVKRKTLPEKIIIKLVYHKDQFLRAIIAMRKNLSLEFYEKLIEDPSPLVICSLIKYQKVEENLLYKFLASDDPVIRRTVAEKENISPDLMFSILGNWDGYDETSTIIKTREDFIKIKEILKNKPLNLASKEDLIKFSLSSFKNLQEYAEKRL